MMSAEYLYQESSLAGYTSQTFGNLLFSPINIIFQPPTRRLTRSADLTLLCSETKSVARKWTEVLEMLPQQQLVPRCRGCVRLNHLVLIAAFLKELARLPRARPPFLPGGGKAHEAEPTARWTWTLDGQDGREVGIQPHRHVDQHNRPQAGGAGGLKPAAVNAPWQPAKPQDASECKFRQLAPAHKHTFLPSC